MLLKTDTDRQNEQFSKVPSISKPRNVFPLIKRGATTHQFDYLHPVYTKEIYPGDTINMKFDFLARLQTQVIDLFDDLYTDVHVWFCPNRLVQTNFKRLFYNTQETGPSQDNSTLTTPYVTPYNTGSDYIFQAKSLYDDLDYPINRSLKRTGGVGYIHISNYKARHYHNIWNLNYRDQNLQNPAVMDYDEGPDNYADYKDLLKRGKRLDMPSSCLPFLQKGIAPIVPMQGIVQVTQTGNNASPLMRIASSNALTGTITGANFMVDSNSKISNSTVPLTIDPNTAWSVNLSSALAGFYVNDLRYTVAVQQLFESDARGGTRDVESLANIWGVNVVDFRVDRPEYLGGATFTFDGHIVPQTSASTGSSYQARLAQFSQQLSSLQIMHSFVEPGFLMVLMSHRANQTYQNYLKKEDTRKTRLDFYNPFFANLGEVAVKGREVWVSGVEANDDATFGYQPYGYELRYDINSVTREMRSNYATPMDSKHLAYNFSSAPVLSDAFIQSNTDAIDRNIVVSKNVADPIQINMKVSGTIARVLPMYSVPGLMRL